MYENERPIQTTTVPNGAPWWILFTIVCFVQLVIEEQLIFEANYPQNSSYSNSPYSWKRVKGPHSASWLHVQLLLSLSAEVQNAFSGDRTTATQYTELWAPCTSVIWCYQQQCKYTYRGTKILTSTKNRITTRMELLPQGEFENLPKISRSLCPS